MADEQSEVVQVWQNVTPVEFSPKIKERTEAQSLLVAARQGAGFEVAAGHIAHAIRARATHMLMDFTQRGCAVRYQIDGEWEQLPPLDRETGDAMLYAIKQLCLMNPADRRSAQTGSINIKLVKDKFDLQIQSQGVQTGERVLAKLQAEKMPFDRMTDLGMRDKMLETFKGALDQEGAMVIITAPKGQGLTTTWTVAMNAADRLIRDFQSLEHEDRPEPEIININPNFFGGETGLTECELVNKLILKEPDVLLFPEFPQPDSLKVSLEQVEIADKSVIMRMVANSPMEALVSVVAKYPDSAKSIAARTAGVICQKLVRRLCDNCKAGFEPSPQLLKQLGIPQGRVAMLYQPFIPPPVEQQVDENGNPAPITPCHECNGRGYKGRIGIFELLTPGDQLKAALLKTRDIAKLTEIAKSEGHRTLQTEAILTVARGLTGLDELKRAFAKK